jgi:hypothetical protein
VGVQPGKVTDRGDMKATEGIEELERLVHEFGDFELQIPDPIELWFYPVDRIEVVPEAQAIRFVSDR